MEPDVAVVMPAYNEADGIGDFLADLHEAFRAVGLQAVFWVVDDRSTDNTAQVVRDAAERHGIDAHVEGNDRNRGHGPTSVAAWRLGIACGAPIVVHVDGDGQYPGSEVVAIARFGDDGAIGVRATRADPWYRRILAAALRVYVNALAGVSTQDPNTPLRAYRREVIVDLLGHLPADPLVPSVYLSALGEVRGLSLNRLGVHSGHRRGGAATGTMWSGGRLRRLLPSRRLIAFVWRALRESFTTLRALRR